MGDVRSYARITVDAPAELADEAAGILWGGEPLGVEETGGGGVVTLTAYWAADAAPAGVAEALHARGLASRLGALPARDWFQKFRESFEPFAPIPGVTVRPPWAPAPASGTDLVIEPGAAFGTGLHESTRLAMGLMAPLVGPGVDVLDVGAGSGILAFFAARRGGAALALEHDPQAVGNLRENRGRNGLERSVWIVCGEPACLGRAFPVVVANLTFEVLGARRADLARLTATGGALVMSGILEAHRLGAWELAGGLGQIEEVAVLGEWMAIRVRR